MSPRTGLPERAEMIAVAMVTPAEVKLDADKAKDWLSKGAQPTETVKSLFKKNGILA